MKAPTLKPLLRRNGRNAQSGRSVPRAESVRYTCLGLMTSHQEEARRGRSGRHDGERLTIGIPGRIAGVLDSDAHLVGSADAKAADEARRDTPRQVKRSPPGEQASALPYARARSHG